MDKQRKQYLVNEIMECYKELKVNQMVIDGFKRELPNLNEWGLTDILDQLIYDLGGC